MLLRLGLCDIKVGNINYSYCRSQGYVKGWEKHNCIDYCLSKAFVRVRQNVNCQPCGRKPQHVEWDLQYSVFCLVTFWCRSLNGVSKMNAFQAGDGTYVSICLPCFLQHDEIWYGHYVTEGYSKLILFNFLQLVVPAWYTWNCEIRETVL